MNGESTLWDIEKGVFFLIKKNQLLDQAYTPFIAQSLLLLVGTGRYKEARHRLSPSVLC